MQNEARPDLAASNFYLDPFRGMSARAVREKNEGHWFNRPMPPAAVIAPFMMATFLLLVACFNFTNNSIAIAGNRLKEIGIRKVLGATAAHVVTLISSDFSRLILLAFLIAAPLGWWAMNEWLQRYEYRIDIEWWMLALAGALTLTLGLLTVSFQAIRAALSNPVKALRTE